MGFNTGGFSNNFNTGGFSNSFDTGSFSNSFSNIQNQVQNGFSDFNNQINNQNFDDIWEQHDNTDWDSLQEQHDNVDWGALQEQHDNTNWDAFQEQLENTDSGSFAENLSIQNNNILPDVNDAFQNVVNNLEIPVNNNVVENLSADGNVKDFVGENTNIPIESLFSQNGSEKIMNVKFVSSIIAMFVLLIIN